MCQTNNNDDDKFQSGWIIRSKIDALIRSRKSGIFQDFQERLIFLYHSEEHNLFHIYLD